MLTFKAIELEDNEVINSYLKRQNYRASDLCFTNLYSWGRPFNTRFAVANGWLFIRFMDNYDRNSYLKPIGEGDIREGVKMIVEDHAQFDSVFQIRGATKEMIAEIDQAFPGRFVYNLNRSVS